MNTVNFIKAEFPNWDNFNPNSSAYKLEKQKALDYARLEMNIKQLKNNVVEYFNKNNKVNSNNIQYIDDHIFITIGKYCWMKNNGAIFDNETNKFFTDRLNSVILKINNFKLINNKPLKFNIDEGKVLFTDLEDLVLTDNVCIDGSNVYSLLSNKKPQPKVLISLTKHLKNQVKFLKDIPQSEANEAFIDIKKTIRDFTIIQRAVRAYRRNLKQERKNGEIRTSTNAIKKSSKITEDVQYKKDDDKLQIISIDPATIIKAKVLLMYNVKNRKISLLYSTNDGFEMRGTTIHNIDEEKSFQKILRDPTKLINSVRDESLQRTEFVLNTHIKSKSQKVSGRTNNDIIFIKRWK